MNHFQSFIIDLMIRPDIVFCVRPYDDDEETLQVPCTLPCCTRFLNAIVSGIIGPINKNTASLEYESDENACSFLSLQYSEKFQFSLFKTDKVFNAPTKDDFNNYCDRDVSNYIDPVILVFQCSKNIYVISQRFLNLVRKAFSPGDFSIVGGIATSLITKGPKEQSHKEKVAGLIIDGRNIYSDVLVHESNDRDELLSSFQTMKANILEKSNNENIDLKHCFMLMISCVARGQDSYDDEENVECDIINKVFPGLPVFGFFGNGEIAYINNKSLETDEPVLSYTSVFCFIRLKDGIWRIVLNKNNIIIFVMDVGSDSGDTASIDSSTRPVLQERAFLETFFHLLSQFQFDRAYDLTEKSKEQFKTTLGTSWMLLLPSITAFANVEKMYFTMAFVEGRLLRREVVRPLYQTLSSDLDKISSGNYTLEGLTQNEMVIETLSVEISRHLSHFIQARFKMIDFYGMMAKNGWGRAANTNELLTRIRFIIDEYNNKFHHPVLDPLKTSFTFEVDTVLTIFETKNSLSEWEFLPSLLSLRDCRTKLHAWCAQLNPFLSSKEQMSNFSYKSLFSRSNKKQADIPALYQWLYQFYESLLSKFSLYFYTTLSAQTNPTEMKATLSKTSIDYMNKILAFEKRTDTSLIAFVLDTSEKKNLFCGHGYHLDTTIREKPLGLMSFPSIVSVATENKSKSMTELHSKYWPDLISILTSKSKELQEKPVYFYDTKSDVTYYLLKVDICITLVLVYTGKKKERDSYIQGFLNEMRTSLQHDQLYQMLKPGQGKVFEKR